MFIIVIYAYKGLLLVTQLKHRVLAAFGLIAIYSFDIDFRSIPGMGNTPCIYTGPERFEAYWFERLQCADNVHNGRCNRPSTL